MRSNTKANTISPHQRKRKHDKKENGLEKTNLFRNLGVFISFQKKLKEGL